MLSFRDSPEREYFPVFLGRDSLRSLSTPGISFPARFLAGRPPVDTRFDIRSLERLDPYLDRTIS